MSEKLTDDEAIAMAMLLGCEFYHRGDPTLGDWFYNKADEDSWHPIEAARWGTHGQHMAWGWRSKADLAHAVVAWHLRQKEAA